MIRMDPLLSSHMQIVALVIYILAGFGGLCVIINVPILPFLCVLNKVPELCLLDEVLSEYVLV